MVSDGPKKTEGEDPFELPEWARRERDPDTLVKVPERPNTFIPLGEPITRRRMT